MDSDIEEGEVRETVEIPKKRQREPQKVSGMRERVNGNKKVEKEVDRDKGIAREKTIKCKYWENGACQKGSDCNFLHQGEIHVKNELCKYFLTGCCMKGDFCGYSHDTTKFPCKYFHGVGVCNSGDECKFSHARLSPHEIPKFIQENEIYLTQVQKIKGETNLGDFFTSYLQQKDFERQNTEKKPKENSFDINKILNRKVPK